VVPDLKPRQPAYLNRPLIGPSNLRAWKLCCMVRRCAASKVLLAARKLAQTDAQHCVNLHFKMRQGLSAAALCVRRGPRAALALPMHTVCACALFVHVRKQCDCALSSGGVSLNWGCV
jgi:hypothetical protein